MGKSKKKFKVLKEGLGIDYYSLDNALFEQNLLMTRLREENETLKDNIEFLHSCLDDRENSIELMKEENKTLKEKLSEVTMIADDEKQSIEHILELEEENKKLNGLLKEYEELLLTKNVCNENYYTRKEVIEKINDKRNEI